AWNEEKERQLATECGVEVEKEITEYLNIKPQTLESIFDFMYETPPQTLRDQRDSLTGGGKG
ncbi:MAG: pyruvate dehydrogenase (acetyl-transferring) E1 component subunit alpha, partial [Gammaproteobacteria bacterium]